MSEFYMPTSLGKMRASMRALRWFISPGHGPFLLLVSTCYACTSTQSPSSLICCTNLIILFLLLYYSICLINGWWNAPACSAPVLHKISCSTLSTWKKNLKKQINNTTVQATPIYYIWWPTPCKPSYRIRKCKANVLPFWQWSICKNLFS